MSEKPDRPVTGIDNTVASLKIRIDELETLLRQKESDAPTGTVVHDLDAIPVLDEIISSGKGERSDAALGTDNGSVIDADRLKEIINTLEKQTSDDLEKLIKLLKHSIMKSIKMTLAAELGHRQDRQYSLDVNGNPVPDKNDGHATGRDRHR